MDHNDKRNSSVPLGTFEPTPESEAAAEASDVPFEGREDTWPNFTVGAERPRRRTRTLIGVPGLIGARDSEPGEDDSERPTLTDSPTASENISQAIAEELDVHGNAIVLGAAEPLPMEPAQLDHVDSEFDPEQEVTGIYDADVVALSDATPPAAAEADGGELIEVAPPRTPPMLSEENFALRNTIPELPSELAGDIPLLTDHMRPPKQERSQEPITITEIAPSVAADGSTSSPPSLPPSNLSSLAPREVMRKRPEPVLRQETSSRYGALLVAAVMLLATGAWYLTSGTFRRASISEAPAPAPTTAAVSQLAMAKPAEPSTKPAEAVAPPANDSAASPNAVASNALPAHAASELTPAQRAGMPQPSVLGPSPKGKLTLTTTSRNLRVKPAPRPKPALVPPPGNGTPEQPSRNQVVERLESVRSSVRACAAGRSGVADLDITIAHTGAVTHVLVGGDFAGTTEGSCIARAVRTARFPTFKQERFRLLFPYAI